jgi:glutathione S-transferase
MSTDDTITFFHAPHTRSSGTRILLEELGAPYELHAINMKAGEQRKAAYLAINPMGKVPAIRHRGELISEQVAIFIYLPICSRRRSSRPPSTTGCADPICAGSPIMAHASSRRSSTAR